MSNIPLRKDASPSLIRDLRFEEIFWLNQAKKRHRMVYGVDSNLRHADYIPLL